MKKWILRANRISKAIGAATPGVALVVVNVATQVTGVTDDGVIDVNEWYVLGFALVSALGAYFAPKNAPPA